VIGWSVPVDVTGPQGRDAAKRELSKAIYHQHDPGLFERGLRWIADRVADLLDTLAKSSSGFLNLSSLAVVVVVVLAVIVLYRVKLGPMARSRKRRSASGLFGDRELTAAEYRASAERHAAEQAWAEAIRDRLRAIVRDLEHRGLLDPRPGRTADEAAREAGRELPTHAEALVRTARTFDDVWYGGRTATPQMYAQIRDVDDAVRRTRPVPVATP
jgi:hypothetical protein